VTPVNIRAGEQFKPEFLAISPNNRIPAIVDHAPLDGGGPLSVFETGAILVYLARKIGPSHWLPSDPAREAEVQRWLSVAAGKIAYGACAARLITVFDAPFRAEEVIARAHATARVIEEVLGTSPWIAGTDEPTIADIALYSYIARAPEGNVTLTPYPRIGAWLRRIEHLPGFVPFARTRAGLEA
jgi:glutathione S-transferase